MPHQNTAPVPYPTVVDALATLAAIVEKSRWPHIYWSDAIADAAQDDPTLILAVDQRLAEAATGHPVAPPDAYQAVLDWTYAGHRSQEQVLDLVGRAMYPNDTTGWGQS